LERLTQQLNLAQTATFHGHRRDIASCIAALDALVMCSDHEGLPMTALEALVAETPMVVHAVGGLSRIVENNAGGLAITQHSPRYYAEAVQHILAMDLHELRKRGLNRLRETYSASINADQVLETYKALTLSPNCK
jgi:glycosyltransferase involved in cell wall biosynthesis